MNKSTERILIFTKAVQLYLFMPSSMQVFWDSINEGYSLIRFNQFAQIFRIIKNLKTPKRTIEETNAILALEEWAATRAMGC